MSLPLNLPARAFLARELLIDWAISKVVTPDSNSRTAPSGKVILIMMFSLYWLSIISKTEVFPYYVVLNQEKQKATSKKDVATWFHLHL